jgi:hypothetical protein
MRKSRRSMPFNLRNFEEEAKAKMGVVSSLNRSKSCMKNIVSIVFAYKLFDFARIINSIISSFIWEAVARHFAIRKSIDFFQIS